MSFEVLHTPQFEERLFQTLEYLAKNYGGRTAIRLVDALESAESTLSATPLRGSAVATYEEIPPANALRWVRAGQYIVVYRTHLDAQTVVLEDLFFNRADWRRLAGPYLRDHLPNQ